MLLSAFCHLAVFIALGLMSVISDDGWRGVKLLVNVGDDFDSAALDDSQLDDAIKLEVAADAAAAVDPVRLFDVSTMATTDMAALEALSENASVASGMDGLALGGTGEADGSLSGGSAEFFGIGGYGQTFVYVVDCSGSMSERGKFQRAIYELLHSIEQLASDQRFYVVFYSDAAYPMDADEPVPANEDEFARTRRWVSHIAPDGGTNPLPALLYALSLRPDAIYFLSDGKFDPVTTQEVRMKNRPRSKRIPIHAIAFMERATEGLMRTIARNSGGEYRFVK
jgi:von Willebrand factor type A domain